MISVTFKKILKVIKNPKIIIVHLIGKSKLKWLDDEKAINFLYRYNFGQKIDLNSPKTFNEKLNWLKLNDRNDDYTTMVDKYEVKKLVTNKVGEQFVIKALGIYNNFDEIDFEKMPNQFVIKTTHDSGGYVIVKNKNKLNIRDAKKKINNSLKRNYFYTCREWPYKNVKPRILIEEYIKDDLIDDLRDYKFLCFNGEPKFVYVTVKNDNIWENYYDMEFKPITWINHGFPRYEKEFEKPKDFDKMIDIARKLSENIPFLGVDLHSVNGKILFGENTFYDWAGLKPYSDRNVDLKLGELVKLPISHSR